MKVFLVLGFFLFFSCFSSDKKLVPYPEFIERNHLEVLFNEAKWELYKSYFHCFPEDSLKNLLSVDFKFRGVDTVKYRHFPQRGVYFRFDIPFNFEYNGYKCQFYRVGFVEDSLCYLEAKYDIGFFEFNKEKSMNLEPIFVDGLKKNKAYLTPWLYAISNKKGIY